MDRAAKGNHLLRLLGEEAPVPGKVLIHHTHWLFPVAACQPKELIAALWEVGFDATQGESLCLVDLPANQPRGSPDTARQLLERMVFVSVYAQMPDSELSRMAAVIRRRSEIGLQHINPASNHVSGTVDRLDGKLSVPHEEFVVRAVALDDVGKPVQRQA